jgi:hypothetical protein
VVSGQVLRSRPFLLFWTARALSSLGYQMIAVVVGWQIYDLTRSALYLGLSLDLFAVLLGGATALLPVYARDILRTGPVGLGLLRAAPAVGALLTSAALARATAAAAGRTHHVRGGDRVRPRDNRVRGLAMIAISPAKSLRSAAHKPRRRGISSAKPSSDATPSSADRGVH